MTPRAEQTGGRWAQRPPSALTPLQGRIRRAQARVASRTPAERTPLSLLVIVSSSCLESERQRLARLHDQLPSVPARAARTSPLQLADLTADSFITSAHVPLDMTIKWVDDADAAWSFGPSWVRHTNASGVPVLTSTSPLSSLVDLSATRRPKPWTALARRNLLGMRHR